MTHYRLGVSADKGTTYTIRRTKKSFSEEGHCPEKGEPNRKRTNWSCHLKEIIPLDGNVDTSGVITVNWSSFFSNTVAWLNAPVSDPISWHSVAMTATLGSMVG